MQKTRKAFTLIELLVVIAIIAILAAILFPVFAQAKASAKKAADLSNMKQIELGTLMYTNDYDDHYMMADVVQDVSPDGNDYHWSSVLCLGPYIKNTQIFLSPLDSSYKPSTSSADLIPTPPRVAAPISYISNSFSNDWLNYGTYCAYFPQNLGITDCSGAIAPGNYWGATTDSPPTRNGPLKSPPLSTTQANNPSNLIVFAGGNIQEDDYEGCAGDSNTETPDLCYSGDLIFGWDGVINASGTNFGTPNTYLFDAWHKVGNGSNFAFADGHAKNTQPGALLSGPFLLNPNYFLAEYTPQ